MRKKLLAALCLTLALVMLLGACGDQTQPAPAASVPASEPAASVPAASTPAAEPAATGETSEYVGPWSGEAYSFAKDDQEYFEWTMYGWNNESEQEFWPLNKWLVEQIAVRTEGHLIIDVVYGTTLASQTEALSMIQAGVIPIGVIQLAAYSNLYLATVDTLPGLGNANTEQNLSWHEYVYFHPQVQAEVGDAYGVYVLGAAASVPYAFVSRGKQINSVSDMNGLIARGTGAWALMFSAAGASPTSVSPADMYVMFSKGQLDLMAAPQTLVKNFLIYEVADYISSMDWNCGGSGLVVNKDAWDELPEYIKDAYWSAYYDIEEVYTPHIEQYYGDIWQELDGLGVLAPASDTLKSELDAINETVIESWIESAPDPEAARALVEDIQKFNLALEADPALRWTPDVY